ncbi:MAG TPA: hypothetical protein DEH78_18860 [Solibacterales bacterium]|nr:hypothetical protein [Bryobacterales bacterium]
MTETKQAGGAARVEFSPEAQAAIAAREISGSWELRKLQKLLGELSHFDEVNQAAGDRAKTRMIIFIVVAVVGLFAAFFAAAVLESGLVFLLPLAAAAPAIYFGRIWSRHKKADLIDDFRVCLRPGLKDLAHDLDPEKKIRVRMDLAGPVDRKKSIQQELPPFPYLKLTETVFEDPWCEVRLPLVDGSTAVLEFTIWWRKLERKYRGSRGKTKFKTKWKKECRAAATLLPAAVTARWDENTLRSRLDPQRERAKLVEKEGVTGARLERFWVFKGASSPPTAAPDARDVVGMLLRLYGAMAKSGEVAS